MLIQGLLVGAIGGIFASYNLCRRRMASPHGILKIPRTQRDEVTETWGYSGYVGLAIKLDRRNKVGEIN